MILAISDFYCFAIYVQFSAIKAWFLLAKMSATVLNFTKIEQNILLMLLGLLFL